MSLNRTKLDYILNPDNRLYEIELVNGENLDDGFLCHLSPLYFNSDDKIWNIPQIKNSVSVSIENETGFYEDGYNFFGNNYLVKRSYPVIHVKIHFMKGELTNDELDDVQEYMKSNVYLKDIHKMV